MGTGDIDFRIALQHASLPQAVGVACLHARIAGERAAVVHHFPLGKDHVEHRRLTDDLGRNPNLGKLGGHALHQRRAGCVQSLIHAGAAQNFQRLQARHRRDRITAQGSRHAHELFRRNGPLVEVGHQLLRAGNRGQREAAADHLAERAEVRRHAVVLLTAAVGVTEAGHHFVENQRHARFMGDLAQSLEEAGLGRYQALLRLHNDGAEFARILADHSNRRVRVVVWGDEHFAPQHFRNARRVGRSLREVAGVARRH